MQQHEDVNHLFSSHVLPISPIPGQTAWPRGPDEAAPQIVSISQDPDSKLAADADTSPSQRAVDLQDNDHGRSCIDPYLPGAGVWTTEAASHESFNHTVVAKNVQ